MEQTDHQGDIFKMVVEAAPNGMVMVDEGGTIVLVNSQAETLFGYSREELIGSSIENLVPARFREKHPGYRFSFAADPEVRSMGAGRELFALRNDGREVPVEIGLNPLVTEQGKFVLASIVDISERKQAEERFRLVVEAAPNGMVMIDDKGLIVLFNKQAEILFGYAREEVIGQPIEVLVPDRFRGVHPDFRAEYQMNASTRAMGAGRELFALRKDGSEVPVEIGLNPVATASGAFTLASIVDISERRRAEDLARARDKALQESELKSKFVANISHELRTPLSSILGMNELLLTGELTEEQERLAVSVQQSAEHLLRVVNDILDLSRIEAGKMRIDSVAVSIRDIVNDVMEGFETSAHKKKLKLLSIVDPRIPSQLAGDPGRINQILVNLVGNAIKFTKQGQVSVVVTIDKEQERSMILRLAVSDTGIGLDSESQNRIFNPFTQVDSSTQRKFGGTGLGLTISKHLVELMGGAIGVNSSKGRGATFWFTVPLTVIENHEESLPIHSADQERSQTLTHHTTVLVVEDNTLLQQMVSRQLGSLGTKPTVVSTGQEALDKLSEQNYDLILMDCHLPFMDGYQATRLIREREKKQDIHTPIVAMTAAAMAGDFERCIQSGMDDYLSKPYTLQQLAAILHKWLGANVEVPEIAPPVEEKKHDESLPVSAYVNFEKLSESWVEADLRNFLQMFTTHAETLVGSLQAAHQNRKSQLLRDLSHKLRGACSMVYATGLQDCCKKIYLEADKENWSDLSGHIAELHEVFVETVKQIREYLAQAPAQSEDRA